MPHRMPLRRSPVLTRSSISALPHAMHPGLGFGGGTACRSLPRNLGRCSLAGLRLVHLQCSETPARTCGG